MEQMVEDGVKVRSCPAIHIEEWKENENFKLPPDIIQTIFRWRYGSEEGALLHYHLP